MAGIHKIKAKQIDIKSVENELNNTFLKKSEVDTELSEGSQNPIANDTVYKELSSKADAKDLSGIHKQIDTLDDTVSGKADAKDVTDLKEQIEDLDDVIERKASANNPTFTGTVILPPINSESGDNLKAATVGYVHEVVKTYSNLIDGGEI